MDKTYGVIDYDFDYYLSLIHPTVPVVSYLLYIRHSLPTVWAIMFYSVEVYNQYFFNKTASKDNKTMAHS